MSEDENTLDEGKIEGPDIVNVEIMDGEEEEHVLKGSELAEEYLSQINICRQNSRIIRRSLPVRWPIIYDGQMRNL